MTNNYLKKLSSQTYKHLERTLNYKEVIMEEVKPSLVMFIVLDVLLYATVNTWMSHHMISTVFDELLD